MRNGIKDSDGKIPRWVKVNWWVVFVITFVVSFLFIDKPIHLGSSAVETKAMRLTDQQRANQWAQNEYDDTHAGRNNAKPANAYKPYSNQFEAQFKADYQTWLNNQPNPGKRCCDFDLPTPNQMWNKFVDGAADGLMCAFYEADSNLDAAECAAATAGGAAKTVLYDPTKVLFDATVGCVQDAALSVGVASTWVAGGILVRRQYQVSSTVWKNRWVLVENSVGAIPKGLYICWAGTYAKHVLSGD